MRRLLGLIAGSLLVAGTAQAATLNTMFTHLANLGAKTEYIDKLDRYLRLALKAQGQCRAVLRGRRLLRTGHSEAAEPGDKGPAVLRHSLERVPIDRIREHGSPGCQTRSSPCAILRLLPRAF